MAFDEISGQINQYLTDDPMQKMYSVVVALQNEDQNRAINMMLKSLEEHTLAGGKGYTINKYFSRIYAELSWADRLIQTSQCQPALAHGRQMQVFLTIDLE